MTKYLSNNKEITLNDISNEFIDEILKLNNLDYCENAMNYIISK